MATAKLRAYTEEEVYELEDAKKKQPAKVIPMNNLQDCAPQNAKPLQPVLIETPPSWAKRNQKILIIAGVAVLVTAVILWYDYNQQKKKLFNRGW